MVVRLSKPPAERRIELATWGALLVWIGVMLMVDERPGVTAVGLGGIMLASAVIQRALGYRAGLLLWGFGLYFLIGGLADLTDLKLSNVALAGVLIAFGALLLIRATGGPGWRSRH